MVEEVMHASDEDQQRQSYRSEANALPFLAIELSCNLILFQAMMSIMINAIDVTRGQVSGQISVAERCASSIKSMAV